MHTPSPATNTGADDAQTIWPPTYEGAIFDFDGTISDTATLWEEVDRAFLAKRGLPYSVDYPRRLSILGFEEGARYTVEHFHLHEKPEDIVEEWMRMSRALYVSKATLRPGVEAFLHSLQHAGIPYALATSNTPELLESMHLIDISSLFSVRVYSKDVARPKSYPDIYEEAARRIGIPPSRCMVFEDLPQALHSAQQAGCRACAVRSGDALQDLDEVRRIADCYLCDWTKLDLTYTQA